MSSDPHASDDIAFVPVESRSLDLVDILSAVQETAYLWDIVSDRMEWESNAAKVLCVRSNGELSTSADFNFLNTSVPGQTSFPASGGSSSCRSYVTAYRCHWPKDRGPCTPHCRAMQGLCRWICVSMPTMRRIRIAARCCCWPGRCCRSRSRISRGG